MWSGLESRLREASYPTCENLADGEVMPRLGDGRGFCCAIGDILDGSEDAVRWEEMCQIADWVGVRDENLRDAYEGYIYWAVVILPYDKSPLPRSFYPFPEDDSMVETPYEREQLMSRLVDRADQYLYCLLYTSPSPRD